MQEQNNEQLLQVPIGDSRGVLAAVGPFSRASLQDILRA